MTSLRDFLGSEIDRGSFPGAVALVGDGDRVLGVEACGKAAVVPREQETTPETLYDLASLTKPLCVGALCQAAPGLALDSAPGRFFPGWKQTRYDGITVEMLLTHTSGLPAWFPLYVRGEGAAAYRRTLAQIEPEGAPGARVLYSDLNFLLLGEILESVYSAPLDRCLSDLVTGPAASGARFAPEPTQATAATEEGDATERAMTKNLGLSYPRFRDGVVWGEVHDGNAARRGGVAGSAGLFGSARDVWSLARVWLRASTDWTRDRTPDHSEARGLAWQGKRGASSAIARFSESSIGHTGFTGTSVWIDPVSERVFVLLTNRIHPRVRDGNFNEVRRRFHEAALDAFSPS